MLDSDEEDSGIAKEPNVSSFDSGSSGNTKDLSEAPEIEFVLCQKIQKPKKDSQKTQNESKMNEIAKSTNVPDENNTLNIPKTFFVVDAKKNPREEVKGTETCQKAPNYYERPGKPLIEKTSSQIPKKPPGLKVIPPLRTFSTGNMKKIVEKEPTLNTKLPIVEEEMKKKEEEAKQQKVVEEKSHLDTPKGDHKAQPKEKSPIKQSLNEILQEVKVARKNFQETLALAKAKLNVQKAAEAQILDMNVLLRRKGLTVRKTLVNQPNSTNKKILQTSKDHAKKNYPQGDKDEEPPRKVKKMESLKIISVKSLNESTEPTNQKVS